MKSNKAYFVKVRASAALDLSLSHYFFHKALLLNVYANDVLKTRRSAWTLYGQQVVNTKDCYEFTRSIGLSDRKSTRLNSSHANISYAVFCLKKKTKNKT